MQIGLIRDNIFSNISLPLCLFFSSIKKYKSSNFGKSVFFNLEISVFLVILNFSYSSSSNNSNVENSISCKLGYKIEKNVLKNWKCNANEFVFSSLSVLICNGFNMPPLSPPLQFIILPPKFSQRYEYSFSGSIINILLFGISLYAICFTATLLPEPELPTTTILLLVLSESFCHKLKITIPPFSFIPK